MKLSKDCLAWLEAQSEEFMVPYTARFSRTEAREIWEHMVDDPRDIPAKLAGWYARLSAPGYLDCTNWDGPYPTENEALEALFETYGE